MSRKPPQKPSEYREGDDPRILWSPDLFLAYGLRPWEMEEFTFTELADLFAALERIEQERRRQQQKK